jgi:tRNA dimethylallyltransferase
MAFKAKRLTVICGPTASGKTDAAITIAKRLGTEIVSADSRQVYREIPIGTAQPTDAQLHEVSHHVIGSRSIHEDYSAGMYARDARAILDILFKEKNDVVMCGGTGLYIKAVCEGLDEVPPSDPGVRKELSDIFEEKGLQPLLTQLEELDPVHFARIDRKNPQRVIRALEACIVSGRPFSSFHGKKKTEVPFQVRKIGIAPPMDILRQRIAERTDLMMEAGWLDEARAVFPHRHLNALNTVGYKELFDHLDGKTTLDEAVHLIKLHTGQFAKRQLTWFKKDGEVEWFGSGEELLMLHG